MATGNESALCSAAIDAYDRIMISKGTDSSNKIPYLDGLRGYSILSVVVMHAVGSRHVPRWLIPANLLLGNGWLGVDIFFAISGFLITTLLLREVDRTGTISLRGFYQRRIARIFPAAYVYIAMIALLVCIGVLQTHWGAFAAASLFCWNYGVAFNLVTGTPDEGIFNHFWTLSLEEQFYLFWPGCLVMLGRTRSRTIAIVSVVLLPFARLASYALFPTSRLQLTAMFHLGIDQIFWGALVALIYTDGTHLKLKGNRYLGWLTLAYAIFTIFVLPPAIDHVPGLGRFVVPTVNSSFGALLLLWLLSGNTPGIVRKTLLWRPLCWVGMLSYSLYVWQQLLLTEKSMAAPFPFNVGLAVLAAILSYYLVESPLRKKIQVFFLRRTHGGQSMADRGG
jgi:peptidoglycan/LPS O-acetylase OafA/YrhL